MYTTVLRTSARYTGPKASACAIRHITVLILGPPGGGKGTISQKITKDFNVYHLSTGDVLRRHVRERTSVGLAAKAFMDTGSFVPDDVMVQLVLDEINSAEAKHVLLDGFPRTVPQAQELQKRTQIHAALHLDIPVETIVRRIANRWTHLPSGRVYAYDYNPPKKTGFDDATGESLTQRDDDKPEAVRERLVKYNTLTAPLVQYFREQGLLHSFAGTESDVLYPKIKSFLITLYG